MNLCDVDLEVTVLGTLVAHPKALTRIGDGIDPAWFSEELMRDLFAAFRKQVDNGRDISFKFLLSELNKHGAENLGGATPGTIAANIAANATLPSSLPALISSLKELWARRSLVDRSKALLEAASDHTIDPAVYAADMAMGLEELSDMDAEPSIGDLGDARTSYFESLKNPERMRGATTGLMDVDRKLGGFRKGFFYVVAARPAMGKTAFVVSSLYKSACAGSGVYMVSLEMSQEEIFSRLASELAHRKYGNKAPQYEALLKAQATNEQCGLILDQTDQIQNVPFIYDTSASLTIAQIRSRARTMKAKFERDGLSLDVVCVDHIGLIRASQRYAGNKTAETGELSGALRAMAKELDCAVVAVSQLSRANTSRDNKRPTLADLRWAGEIEQDAHAVLFVHREAYYADEQQMMPGDLQNLMRDMEIIVAKNRNGSVGIIHVDLNIGFNRIDNAAYQSQQGEAA